MNHAELLMLCPSRNRPDNVADLIVTWCLTTSGRSELLVAVDDDDPQLADYRHVEADLGPLVAAHRGHVEFVYGPRLRLGPTLDKLAAERAPQHYAIGFLGDDHRPRTDGWDTRFLDVLHTMGTGMVYGNDLLQGENLPTAIAMTSDIPAALGYFATPGCVHLFLDDMWKQLGRAVQALTYLPDVIVEHVHPLAGKAAVDEGYVEVNSPQMYEHDRAAYQAWVRGDFTAAVRRVRAAGAVAQMRDAIPQVRDAIAVAQVRDAIAQVRDPEVLFRQEHGDPSPWVPVGTVVVDGEQAQAWTAPVDTPAPGEGAP